MVVSHVMWGHLIRMAHRGLDAVLDAGHNVHH